MSQSRIDRININIITNILSKALNQNIINTDDTAVILYDLSLLESRLDELRLAFDNSTLHAIAIKANPLISILKRMNALGFGAEAASLPELYIAQKAGFSSDRIVFDSPAKTIDELEYAIKANVHINADSLIELEHIDKILRRIKSKSTFGLRINPWVGAGKIKTTSVAGEYSKFGVPLKHYRKQIAESYLNFNWLTGIHLHIGSQGIPLVMLVKGAKNVYELAEQMNSELEKAGAPHRINIFDIGGGLPATYIEDDPAPTISEYANALKTEIPGLFDGRHRLITEFGRCIHANAAWVVSRAEHVKKQGDLTIAIIHLGADMFIRKCYNPDDWHHDISVVDKNGKLKSGAAARYVIAGPLCFAGDIIARDIELPEMNRGDYVIIHDVGAYTFSMWSRYNSRQMPKVIGYYNNGESFEILKKRESPDDIYKFWQ